ncbi:type IX secretion system sortase PorU [Hymenobacter sp. BT770]|uniref:type IX secretion system sortase PorU n=1 Tax=Hymenobacter sp. BT770 TaxID=2886942 RepID=UPI001D12BCBC|nr:type IX secretion system sortase PorU [Hymenobacter sp. BT770]MCC3151506.1 type IX secretion system sortase PorU [Hymenobacter sp. BT770]MDO3413918.1 type IX secretion system sortase PorU [Hymenobacter sp. BT770]
MRLIFLCVAFAGLILGAATPIAAQSGGEATAHGVIKWGGYAEVPTLNSRKQKVPTFDEAHQALDDQVGWFSLRLNGEVGAGELVNMVYEPFSAADAKLFDAARLPAGPEPKLSSGTEMKRVVSHLSLRPVRRNPQTGQPERLMSFDYRYSPNASPISARGSTANRPHASHSVLATGDWYKMGVAESGIYKLDKEALLRILGRKDLQGINPNNLHVYGNSMGILPQANAVPRPDDLAENNVLLVGNGDNVFDDNEYFLFYSPGAHTWEAQGGVFRHRNNIYTDTTYYFVTVNNTAGRRVPTAAAPAATASTPTINAFTYRDFYEHDLLNLMHKASSSGSGSGRNWVGEVFGNGAQKEFLFGNIPDLVPNSPIRVTSSLVANSATASAFQLTLNGSALGSQSLDARPNYDFGAIATVSTVTRQLTLANPGTELKVGLTYNSGDPAASAYLDYLEINAQRQLRLSGSQLEFRSLSNIAPKAVNRFELANANGATVWDVTNPRQATARALALAGSTGTFLAPADTLREYVAFQPNGTFGKPREFGKVDNQDLHALNSNAAALVDLVIVTYPAFKGQAQRLANHRTSHDNLRVAVVTTSEVYNEYGSGGQDITAIRDMMKQLYDRAPQGKQMQLLLFGDASFDYKSDPYNNKSFEPAWWKDRTPFKNDADFDAVNQNYVPTYESRESLAPFYGGAFGQASYSSDDYFALLDDDEGEWSEQSPGSELLDIGVGRLPIRTPKGDRTNAEQAKLVVDKLISYDAPAAYGKWRNRITLVSDDGNGDLFVGQGSELIAKVIQTDYPVYNVHKVYLDLYPQLSVSAGQRSPEASRAIDQSVEQGSLIVNYLGHGGPKGWTDEQILTNASVLALRNANNLTFFTTGTCDFSTYDNPDFTSAGEQSLTDNPTGGAIGLFTTTRVVDAGLNAGLNQAYFNRVLRPLANGQMPSIGTVVMLSKNDYPGAGQPGVINNRNYTLLADPSMTLAYPRQTVALDSIRTRAGAGPWTPTDTLQALARVRLHGRLLNNGAVNSAFTGVAQVTIYDKPSTVKTLGNEAGGDPNSADAPRPVVIQESVIYGGQANVVNGEFNLTFVVPKDINYNVGLGKVSLYAFDGTHRIDAHGYQLKQVGGAARDFLKDTTPPVIKLFMDNESFVFGGLTGQNTTLLAQLSDSSGINTTGAGIGHDITAVLDNDPTKLIVLNDSYVAKVGDFRSGQVNNLFKDLPTGPHTLRLKAWDTYNNSAEKEIEFIVAHNEKLALDHVLNYPNPFATSTTFFFDHNQAGSEPTNLDVQVQIFTVSGHLVRTLTAVVPSTDAHQRSISWNGRDEYNDQLARGVYVYRLSVRSQLNGTSVSKYEKLVILN